MKKCIIHLPNKLDEEMISASHIRPRKMIKAFMDLGYEVDVVEGTGQERKQKIKEIKRKIQNGSKYSFMYAESSTMPTLLTDPCHLPLHPWMDFSFFRFIKNHNIRIGLFYRDMYWKFPMYRDSLGRMKSTVAIHMYKYDLRQYNKYLDKLYVPSEKCFQYLNGEVRHEIMDVLPPGSDRNITSGKDSSTVHDNLVLLYVGGLGHHYIIEEVLKAVVNIPNITLILCCREQEWNEQKKELGKYSGNNIRVVHEKGEGLKVLYDESDIGILLFKPDEYTNIAIPYKTFEYLSYGLPVISSAGGAVSELVTSSGVGWVVQYDATIIKKLLEDLIDKPIQIVKKSEKARRFSEKNQWINRAEKVAFDLTVQ